MCAMSSKIPPRLACKACTKTLRQTSAQPWPTWGHQVHHVNMWLKLHNSSPMTAQQHHWLPAATPECTLLFWRQTALWQGGGPSGLQSGRRGTLKQPGQSLSLHHDR